MTHEELHRLIRESSRGDWKDVGLGGPTFLYGYVTEGEHQFVHHSLAVFKPNISLAYAWGMTGRDRYEWEWVKNFPDPSARTYFIDILYNSALVDRELAVSVDGGRALLPSPLPMTSGDTPDPGTLVGWDVERSEYDFVRTFARLVDPQGVDNFDEYFKRAQLQIRDGD
jgi:hypothetical protein